jgi:hypothetical protein
MLGAGAHAIAQDGDVFSDAVAKQEGLAVGGRQ